MGQEIIVPDWAKQRPAQAFAVLNPQDDNLAAGIGQSYPVIGYKGKVWSIRHRGERHTFVRPDDGSPSNYIDVIVLGQAKQKSKSYYKQYDQNQSDGARPICASIDGVVPDPDVTTKQSDTCALCPRNVWKTDPATGRKGRECTDYKRLAVLILPSQTKAILGEALLEPCFLRVPPASLNSLAIMGDTMANQGFHFSTYITRISFDPDEAHPKMVFRPLQGLTDKEAPVILGLRSDPNVGRITGGDIVTSGPGELSDHSTSDTLASATAPGAAGITIEGQVNSSPPKTSAPPATPPASPPPSKSAEASSLTVDTGLGGVTTASTVIDTGKSTVQDSGAAEASDDDLDARIAGLISK